MNKKVKLKHFYEHIPGWFDAAQLYTASVNQFGNGSIFVEVGAWKGRSAAYMATEIINSKKKIDFYVVDTWKGSDESEHKKDKDIDRLFEVFTENMQKVDGYYKPMQMTSVEASLQFENCSIDFLYLDASHDFKSVYQDLEYWFPKVKRGGYIAGHDYTKHWPGVVQAVDKFFMSKAKELKDQNSWIYKK